ncbi:CDC42 small effector protein 2-B-like isoform X1 [Pyrgilauda ruficollis]|uniref:CDC42 small effector protein 2-B-like isoform X1 n=1 Tax=Pyrgilauda ruficollis TaxID=221976 RepID=UPI001B87EA10|nr:CDC42 small effector protein 2-B-like isoform X1 [Pyrgilauda ruficollis]
MRTHHPVRTLREQQAAARFARSPTQGDGHAGCGRSTKRRRRLDRNMIGEPMNFVHTAHVGARDMSSDYSSAVSIQDHMKSKGGYTNGTSATVEI